LSKYKEFLILRQYLEFNILVERTIIKKILAKNIGKKVHTPPDPQINGAFGAALYAQETKI